MEVMQSMVAIQSTMKPANYITISHDTLDSRSPSPEPELELEPEPEADNAATPRRASYDAGKRTAVPVACLRCRRRKVRCSGLPGPCASCKRFGVACIDPGKRRSRSRSSIGERPVELFLPQHDDHYIHSPRPLQLHLQTSNLFHDDSAAQFGDPWSYAPSPLSPACYSDVGPELDPNWFSLQQDPEPEHFSGITRSQTFPNQPATHYDHPDLHSPIPSIQITSHDGSPMSSPALQPTFALPIRSHEELAPLQTQGFINTQMDYYSDYLSPTDQPPAMSRRASVSYSHNSQVSSSNNSVVDWTSKIRPSKRRHTTCSITKPGTSADAELGWMLNSPRTTSYLNQYLKVIHPQYSFLDPHSRQETDISPFSGASEAFTSIKTCQRLLSAAIGAMHQHNSRDISARYVRNAMAVQKREDLDLFSSISGIHCAMLLAIYIYQEGNMTFEHEEEDTTHPDMNLWMWNCRIAAACLDLGLHEWMDDELDGGEESNTTDGDLYRNTFHAAWKLDRQISATKRRPRAIHADDVDPFLLKWIEAKESRSTTA